jgi:hypothetical protein
VAIAPGGPERQAARGAVLALVQALRIERQHPDRTELHRTAARRARELVLAVAQHHTLVLGIGNGELTADGDPVATWSAAEAPFATLREAGIGALVLGPGLDAAGVETLLAHLRAVGGVADAERGTAALRHAVVTGVQLRAAANATAPSTHRPDDWILMPPVAPPPANVQALVARELATNLPAAAAATLFDDFAHDPPPALRGLVLLLGEMLARGDTATAAWLLEEASRHDRLTDGDRQLLQGRAEAICDEAWFEHRLQRGSRDEVFATCGLALQLGAHATARFARLVQRSGHDLAPLLLPLLPTG